MGWLDDIAEGSDDFIKRFNEQAAAKHQQEQQEEESKVQEIGNGKGKAKPTKKKTVSEKERSFCQNQTAVIL
jgi:hypothetical protein